MGDFSSTFSIVNNLDTDLVVSKNGSPRYGRWLRWPNNGKVELLSTSEQFQLKDELGLSGTEGSVWITGKRPDTHTEFKIGLHIACPTGAGSGNFEGVGVDNYAYVWQEGGDAPLVIGAGPLRAKGHPVITNIVISWIEKPAQQTTQQDSTVIRDT